MSLTGHNLRRRQMAEVKKNEPVVSKVTEVKDDSVATLEPVDETVTKPIHKKTGKK